MGHSSTNDYNILPKEKEKGKCGNFSVKANPGQWFKIFKNLNPNPDIKSHSSSHQTEKYNKSSVTHNEAYPLSFHYFEKRGFES